jgi:competence protein ComEC
MKSILIPNKPLVFYVTAFYIGCVSYIVFNHSFFIGAVLAASFLIIILTTVDKKFSIIITCFFIAAVFISSEYYKITNISKTIDINVVKKKEFYSLGRLRGRNVILKGDISKLNEGDKVLAFGKFEKDIDYSRGIAGTFYIDQYKLYKGGFRSRLQSIKRSSYSSFEKYLGKERAAIVMSLCFGETAYLSEQQQSEFKELGVVHAISVSGFHMAIIYKLLEGILGILASIAVSFIYVVFTGSQAATVRAFLMILVLKFSKKVFRNYDCLSALSLSALIILSVKPYFVLDAGFILSYLSTLGLILYYDKIKRAFFKLPKSINESLSLTLSAQVLSAAYAGMVFSNISFGFLLGNIILLPMYTVIVIVGNLGLLLVKLEFIFNLVCKLIAILMIIIDGAVYLLLKITPPVSEITYLSSLSILLLAACFMLVKKGYSHYKYAPLFILGMVVIQSYSFIPRIDYISMGYKEGIMLSYKNEKILIHDLDDQILEIGEGMGITKIIANPTETVDINFGKYSKVRVIPSKKGYKEAINLEVNAFNNKTIITRNTEEFMDVDLAKYDIIRLPKGKYYPFKGNVTNKLPKITYGIIFSKVYSMN